LKNDTLVLGIGNILLGDEGAGIHVVTRLQEEGFTGADLVDGGTGGLHLLGLIQSYRNVIIADASLDQYPAGNVRIVKTRYAKDFPHYLSAHEIGLKDLLDAAFLLGNVPELSLVAISVKDFREIGLQLSPEIKAAVTVAAEKVKELVRSFSD
jgi:hydrogenase maturation protease